MITKEQLFEDLDAQSLTWEQANEHFFPEAEERAKEDVKDYNNGVIRDWTGSVDYYLEEYFSENPILNEYLLEWWKLKFQSNDIKSQEENPYIILDTLEKQLWGYRLSYWAQESMLAVGS